MRFKNYFWVTFLVAVAICLYFITEVFEEEVAQDCSAKNQMVFLPYQCYEVLQTTDPKVYEGSPPIRIKTGEENSESSSGYFIGGRGAPMTIIGSWGPGNFYLWQDYIKLGKKAKVNSIAYNTMALPNGIAMIHWKQNNLKESLGETYTIEMITGWGSYSKKVIPNDFGWINGVIINLLDRNKAPFIHIYYRKENGKNAQGAPQGTLYFWEMLIKKEDLGKVTLLYKQLREHVEKYWAVIEKGKIYTDYSNISVPEPLASLMKDVYFTALPSNQQMATIPPEYWVKNVAFPENNIK